MEELLWITAHWFDLIQTVGIIAGLLFTAHTIREDERATRIGNLIAINQEYSDLWQELFDQPQLSRILEKNPDLARQPITDEECLFVKMLLLHLDTVRRAIGSGMFVEIEGIRKDIHEFLTLPIPKAVWNRLRPFQDKQFIEFVEIALR